MFLRVTVGRLRILSFSFMNSIFHIASVPHYKYGCQQEEDPAQYFHEAGYKQSVLERLELHQLRGRFAAVQVQGFLQDFGHHSDEVGAACVTEHVGYKDLERLRCGTSWRYHHVLKILHPC